jgi:hypothetical protein
MPNNSAQFSLGLYDRGRKGISRHNFGQRILYFARRWIHHRRTQAHTNVRRLRRWRCFDSASDAPNHQFGLEAICEIKNKDDTEALTKMHPTDGLTRAQHVYEIRPRKDKRGFESTKGVAAKSSSLRRDS